MFPNKTWIIFFKSNSGPQGRSKTTHRYLVPCPKRGLDIVTLNNAMPKSKTKCYHSQGWIRCLSSLWSEWGELSTWESDLQSTARWAVGGEMLRSGSILAISSTDPTYIAHWFAEQCFLDMSHSEPGAQSYSAECQIWPSNPAGRLGTLTHAYCHPNMAARLLSSLEPAPAWDAGRQSLSLPVENNVEISLGA